MDNYTRGGHTKYSLMIHLIFVTKYRKQIFFGNIDDDIKQYMFDICSEKGYEIIEMETDKDHIHILLKYQPNVPVSQIAKELKQYSTFQAWKYYYGYLKHNY